jgi:tellurite resistance protein TerC
VDPVFLWIGFTLLIGILLGLDLFVFHRHAHVIQLKEAVRLSAFWIAIALVFNVFIYYALSKEAAINFLTGYVVEKSLSVDNLFVFLLIFNYFKVPKYLTHKVLFWGVLGAIVTRAIFIFFGVALITAFHWMFYIFGILLIMMGFRLAFKKDEGVDLESNGLIQLFKKYIPMTSTFENGYFWVKKGKYLHATPLFLALVAVETTDIIFALDSIPAIIGITTDPFIIYSSNILAILGLRSLYFALAHVMDLFHYFHYGLALVLIFIGLKMLLEDIIPIPVQWSLAIIAGILGITLILSIFIKKKSN